MSTTAAQAVGEQLPTRDECLDASAPLAAELLDYAYGPGCWRPATQDEIDARHGTREAS